MPSSRLISLDTESYGSVTHTHLGTPLTRQNHFHPLRCLAQDHPPGPDYLAHTVTLTQILHGRDHRDITGWEPGTTQILHPYFPEHRRILRSWLTHTTTILGTNIPYDIKMLWAACPELRPLLSRLTHRLVDVTVLNYLHSELRPERSLKSLGPLLGTHRYDRTLNADGRFPRPSDPAHESYAAQDSHNNILAANALARGILRDHPGSAKLTPYSQNFYSNTLWTCIEMSYAGVPFVGSKLTKLHEDMQVKHATLSEALRPYDLHPDGPEPQIRRNKFLGLCVDQLVEHNPTAMDRLELTDKTKAIRFSSANRSILRTSIPQDSPLQQALTLFDEFSYADKLLGTYTWKRLHHKRKDPTNQRDKLLPHPTFPDTLMAYPSWYPTPAPEKDGAGDDGGTKQARITCLHGDTLVITSDGDMPIREAVTKSLDVLAFNRTTGEMYFTQAQPVFGGVQPLLEITYSGRNTTGTVFCSPEHRWVLKSGLFIEAKDLRKGHSLRHAYRYIDNHGYPRLQVRGNGFRFSKAIHSLNLPVSSGYEVHHKDEDKTNFKRSNLEAHTRSSHQSIHSSQRKNKVTFHCENCNKEVTARKSVHRHRFCTRSCYHEYARNNYRVESIKPAGHAEVFCFTVPTHETFVLSDGLVSGNCKYPTLQTDPPELQACLQPLISCDLSQIELRVPGILSGEPAMLRAYNEGIDLHYERGDSMAAILRSYNEDLYNKLLRDLGDKFRKVFRQGGKGINFADLFWSSAATMQAQVAGLMGIVLPLDFFQRIANNRSKDRPVLYAWQESLVREAHSTNKLTLPLVGQSRYFWPKQKKGRRTAWPTNEIVNFPVQATAGNVMLDFQSRVQTHFIRHNLPYRVCLNIYDAFYIRHLLRPTFTGSESTRITGIINECLHECTTIGYWHDLQQHYGRTLPLVIEIKTP